MRKVIMRISACVLIIAFVWLGTVLSDRRKLNEELIRIHVVADSDSPEDQNMKLTVRDAVLESLKADMECLTDITEAKHYLQKKLPYIQEIARQTLDKLGCGDDVVVTLQKCSFDKKSNALYALPAGIYESLRITIGSGQGKNWWGIMFPDVCSFQSETNEIAAPVSGFPASLECCLYKTGNYKLRFFLLDTLGRMENLFFKG